MTSEESTNAFFLKYSGSGSKERVFFEKLHDDEFASVYELKVLRYLQKPVSLCQHRYCSGLGRWNWFCDESFLAFAFQFYRHKGSSPFRREHSHGCVGFDFCRFVGFSATHILNQWVYEKLKSQQG